MPQAPLPNTGIILPSDLGDGDAWAPLLDACFRDYDGHTHAGGDGAQIHIASIAIDSDINFVDAGAVKHGIYNLKVVDFFNTPPASLASFSNALYVADGTGGTTAGELYWLTTAGQSVKLTDGITLNVAGFTGGFGGDYGAVGALASFDDGTDAYWFKQQLGAAVRQWAKMQCSNITLFEFKGVGVTPVPNNNITLKVPAGLANTFILTLPGALPASTLPVTCDSTGALAFGASMEIGYTCALAIPGAGVTQNPGAGTLGPNLQLNASVNSSSLPIGGIPVGYTITSWSVRVVKGSGAGVTVTARLWKTDHTGGAVGVNATQVGATQSNNANAPGNISLGQAVSSLVATNTSYYVEIFGGGTPGDTVVGWSAVATLS